MSRTRRKSNNFNCILCFWLNYSSFSCFSRTCHFWSYVFCNPSLLAPRFRWHIWLNRGSSVISLWAAMMKRRVRGTQNGKHVMEIFHKVVNCFIISIDPSRWLTLKGFESAENWLCMSIKWGQTISLSMRQLNKFHFGGRKTSFSSSRNLWSKCDKQRVV